jgi:3-deoxy-D-manno-octulosonic-acid transferase
MRLLYDLSLLFYHFAIRFAALFNRKAKDLVAGRNETMRKLSYTRYEKNVIWFHAASLGEFEQGRPLIESIRKNFPEKKVLLTFFSPSGYEIRKGYSCADYVLYLPGDSPWSAARIIDTFNPQMAFFIKYEFWYHYLRVLNQRNIPVYGVSVIFREHQPFFKWYGKWFRQMLGFYTRFYLQDKKSEELLLSLGYQNGVVCGDTRFDRVHEIASASRDITVARQFVGSSKVIVAGSTWGADEEMIARFINQHPDVKLIVAPHEVHEEHIKKLEALFTVPVFRYTQTPANPQDYQVMVINSIGLLSSLYRYGSIAYVGGGFGKGIHNTIEAATYGIPVVFGPNYKKFNEACDLVDLGGGFAISKPEEFKTVMERLLRNNELLVQCGKKAGAYVDSMRGATELIMKEVFGVQV